MTATLGKPQGLFSLDDSDHFVGSYLRQDDVKEIFDVSDDDLSELTFVDIGGVEAIDEMVLHKAWHNGEIRNAPRRDQSSMDEIILKAVLRKSLAGCCIERQQSVGRFKLDLKITLSGASVFIEFDGPSHFAVTKYGIPKHHPFRKKRLVEEATGIEVVNWAYWIQRCDSNVKALFDPTIVGYGALWSTNVHFGDFHFDDSADIIDAINGRFNCRRSDGCGYFYEGNTEGRFKPEHPIVGKIASGREQHERLLPRGHRARDTWLPSGLRIVT